LLVAIERWKNKQPSFQLESLLLVFAGGVIIILVSCKLAGARIRDDNKVLLRKKREITYCQNLHWNTYSFF
jgi:hypothetical protein